MAVASVAGCTEPRPDILANGTFASSVCESSGTPSRHAMPCVGLRTSQTTYSYLDSGTIRFATGGRVSFSLFQSDRSSMGSCCASTSSGSGTYTMSGPFATANGSPYHVVTLTTADTTISGAVLIGDTLRVPYFGSTVLFVRN